MDFHSLTRRELQVLCKKNKIPANMTNIAMADALKALENVEGLEEFLNHSESNPSQDSEKRAPESPCISRTATRTSVRRKPTKEEPGSSQPITRTLRGTRKTVTDEISQENKDVNILLTPVVPTTRRRAKAKKEIEDEQKEAKNDVAETPAVQSGWKSRRTVECQKGEVSVQRVYSTRRSVRLLEKGMADLSLKEKGRTAPVKMDTLDDAEEKKDVVTEFGLQAISEIAPEILSGQSPNDPLESEEMQDDKQENNKIVDSGAKPGVADQIFGVSDVKGKAYDENTHESNVLLSEISDKAIEMNDASVDGKVNEDPSRADKLNKDLEPLELNLNANEDQGPEDFPAQVYEDVSASENQGPEDFPAQVYEDVSASENLVSGEELVGANPMALRSGNPAENSENECQKLQDTDMDMTEDDHDVNEDTRLQFSTEEVCDGTYNVSNEKTSEEGSDSPADTESDQEDIESEVQLETTMEPSEEESDSDSDDNTESEHEDLESEAQFETKIEPSEEESDSDSDKEDQEDLESEEHWETETELSEEGSESENDEEEDQESNANAAMNETKADCFEKSAANQLDMLAAAKPAEEESMIIDNGVATYGLEDPTSKTEQCDAESLVDVTVIEAENFAMTSKSERQVDPFVPLVSESQATGSKQLPKVQHVDGNFVDVHVMPEIEFAETTNVKQQLSPYRPLNSGGKNNDRIGLSPLAAKPFPDQIAQPTRLTLLQSSSGRKQTTIRKLASFSEINKENIDNSGGRVEPKKDKVKKNMKSTIDEDSLNSSLSLRQLTKMVREKVVREKMVRENLIIANQAKNDEDKNVTMEPVEKARLALQTLPENRMPVAAEAEEQ